MGKVLEATIKEELREVRKDLASFDKLYIGLKNKESEFANDILSCAEIKREIVKILAEALERQNYREFKEN